MNNEVENLALAAMLRSELGMRELSARDRLGQTASGVHSAQRVHQGIVRRISLMM